MYTPIVNDIFDSQIVQLASSSSTTCATYIQDGSCAVLQMGSSYVTANQDDTRSTFTIKETDALENLFAQPFDAPTNIPIYKVVVGEHFILLLTHEGEVFSYGLNDKCQLGIDDPSVIVATEPVSVKFIEKQNIVDIGAGQTHCVAVNDKGQAFVWGQGMSILN